MVGELMAIDFKEMDEYLQKRRARYGYVIKSKKDDKKVHDFFKSLKEAFSNLFSRKEEVVDLSVEEEPEDETYEEPEEVNEEPEEEYEEEPEEQSEPWHKRFIKRIHGIFKKNDEVVNDEEVIEDVIEIDYEEIKQAFRIANSLIKKLPPAILKAFKESDDYRIYYNLMDKLDLVKKKKNE